MVGDHENVLGPDEQPDHIAALPFYLIHVVAFFGIYWIAVKAEHPWHYVLLIGILYYIRMFAITAFMHRYFAHNTFRITTPKWLHICGVNTEQRKEFYARSVQFLMALLVTSSAQKGVIWWAAWHQHHHKESDTEHDVHSFREKFEKGQRLTNKFKAFMDAIYWSHLGWILCPRFNKLPKENYAKRLKEHPELMLLEKPIGYLAAPVVLAVVCFCVFGLHGLLSFFISTTLLYHGTFCINSLAHMLGDQRFATGEGSRNHWVLNLLTLGEGWHNNHHRYPNSMWQALTWWEKLTDISGCVLWLWSLTGMIYILPDERKPVDST